MKHIRSVYLLVFCGLVAVSGCTGKRPFLMVQMCLGDQKNLEDFKDLMREIAQSEQMKFTDGSAETKQNLEKMRQTIQDVPINAPVINIGVEQNDGMGLGAGNLGLKNYQVVIGFSEGANINDAKGFADRVIARLNARWKLEYLPTDIGAQPMAACK